MLVRRIDAPRKARGYKRLVEYLLNPKGLEERVAHVQVTNCHSLDPMLAVSEVLATQHLNLRTKWKERTYHLLYAFPFGELPELNVLGEVERALCEAIGVAEHQRISVVHIDTNFLHVHVAINAIHPTTLKKAKLSYDEYKLQDCAAELEWQYGLRPGRHHRAPDRLPDGAAAAERHGDQVSLVRWIREHVAVGLQQATSWQAVHALVARNGLRLERQGGGLVFVANSLRVKASSVARDLSLRALEKRLQTQFEAAVGRGLNVVVWEGDEDAELRAAIGTNGPLRSIREPRNDAEDASVARERHAGGQEPAPAQPPSELERWAERHVAEWKRDEGDDNSSLIQQHDVVAEPLLAARGVPSTAVDVLAAPPLHSRKPRPTAEQLEQLADELAREVVANGTPSWADADYAEIPSYDAVPVYGETNTRASSRVDRLKDVTPAEGPIVRRFASERAAQAITERSSGDDAPRRQDDSADERARLWSNRIEALALWHKTQARASTLLRRLDRLEIEVKAEALANALRSLTRQREAFEADGIDLSENERLRFDSLLSGLRRELDALGLQPATVKKRPGGGQVRIIRVRQWRLYAAYRMQSPLEKLWRAEQTRLRRVRAQQLRAARELFLAELQMATGLRQLQRHAVAGMTGARQARTQLAVVSRQRIARVKEDFARRQHEIRVLYRPLSWVPWLQKRALGKDREALRVLRCRATGSGEMNGIASRTRGLHDGLRSLVEGASIEAVTKTGTVIYTGDWAGVRDRGVQLDVTNGMPTERMRALIHEAVRRFGTQLRIVGNEDFSAAVKAAARDEGLNVSFVQETQNVGQRTGPGVVWAERIRSGANVPEARQLGGGGRVHQSNHRKTAGGHGPKDRLHKLPGSAVDAPGGADDAAKSRADSAKAADPRVLLPTNAPTDHLGPAKDTAAGMRRPASRSRSIGGGKGKRGQVAAPTADQVGKAAAKYVAERMAKRGAGLSGIPEHRPFPADASGQYRLAGRRNVDGVDLVLLERDGVVFVAGTSAMTTGAQAEVGDTIHVRRNARRL